MGLKAIGVDIDDSVLATAQKAGVDGTVNSRTTPNVADQIKKIIGDADDKPVGGADAVVVFTAVKAGYDLAPSLIKVGGVLVVVGCPPEISFNAVEVALGKYSIRGANNHGTPEMLRECADFTAAHAIESPVQLFRIDQVGEMIDRMEEGKLAGNRLVVDFSQNT
jgi:propanol-preferring alcohol dehydrogenase